MEENLNLERGGRGRTKNRKRGGFFLEKRFLHFIPRNKAFKVFSVLQVQEV